MGRHTPTPAVRCGRRASSGTAVGMSAVLAAIAMAMSVGTASAAPATATGALVPDTPCTDSARACVDLRTHRSWLLDQGRVVRGPVPMMDGDQEDPTPVGTYAVEWKAVQWTSREYRTPMPYSVFFAAGGVAFHEGQQDTPSAGCVKLGPEDARAWFQFLGIGDQVQVR